MIVEMIVFLPMLILAALFRNTKSSSSSRVKKMKSLLKAEIHQETKSFKFAWWFKIVLYFFSFTCMSITILFIIIMGLFNFVLKFRIFNSFHVQQLNSLRKRFKLLNMEMFEDVYLLMFSKPHFVKNKSYFF